MFNRTGISQQCSPSECLVYFIVYLIKEWIDLNSSEDESQCKGPNYLPCYRSRRKRGINVMNDDRPLKLYEISYYQRYSEKSRWKTPCEVFARIRFVPPTQTSRLSHNTDFLEMLVLFVITSGLLISGITFLCHFGRFCSTPLKCPSVGRCHTNSHSPPQGKPTNTSPNLMGSIPAAAHQVVLYKQRYHIDPVRSTQFD